MVDASGEERTGCMSQNGEGVFHRVELFFQQRFQPAGCRSILSTKLAILSCFRSEFDVIVVFFVVDLCRFCFPV